MPIYYWLVAFGHQLTLLFYFELVADNGLIWGLFSPALNQKHEKTAEK